MYLEANKQPSKIFRVFEVRKKVQLMFRKTNGRMKGKCYVFRDYIQRNKVCLVDLECKLKEGTYG